MQTAVRIGVSAVIVPVRKLRKEAQLPRHGSEQAAGYDLYACTGRGATVIPPHQARMVETGLCAAIPDGYFGGVFARSGIASRMGLRPSNCVGVIDSDYRGEIMVSIRNDSEEEQVIRDGERIAQLIILPYLAVSFEETDQLDETERGNGGFGHTGMT